MARAHKFSAQEQEERILAAAAKCIEESSLLDFTMSSIGKEAGLSMGSIYKHIQTKEDVLVALATQTYKKLERTLSRILELPLTMPERLIAFSLITPEKVRLYPFDDHLEMLIGNEAILKRASSGWIEKLMRLDQSLEKYFIDTLRSNVEEGELLIAEVEREGILEEILVSLWAMCVGYRQVVFQRHARSLVGEPMKLPFPLAANDHFINTVRRLLNTYPWRQPLTDEGIEKTCRVLVQSGMR
jgi:AcrR family transcriptional regulator